MSAHTLHDGSGGLVDVYALYGAAGRRGGGAADGVVEENYFVGAGDGVQKEAGDFGVVELGDGGVGGEVGAVLCRVFFGGEGEALEDLEGVVVEREGRLEAADVVDGDGEGLVRVVTLGKAGGRVDVVEGA